MSTIVIEVKVRAKGQPSSCWAEDKEPIAKINAIYGEAGKLVVEDMLNVRVSDAAIIIARAMVPDAVEVRWNMEGSSQGHCYMVTV